MRRGLRFWNFFFFFFFSYDVRRNFVDKLTKLQKHVKILVSMGHLSLQKDNYCENASRFQGHFFL